MNKYSVVVRWQNASGRVNRESVTVESDNFCEARCMAEMVIVTKYPNVYNPRADYHQ